jgi:hypothetical protein
LDPQTLSSSSKEDGSTSGTGGVLGKLYGAKSPANKPMVRIIFEKYGSSNGTIGLTGLQNLCYDFGTFLATAEIQAWLVSDSDEQPDEMNFDEFQRWWKNNDKIR